MNHKSGFTLVEVLAATAIFALCVYAIVDSQRTSQRVIVQSERFFQATNLARLKMSELELKYQRELNTNGPQAILREENGSFESPYQDFTWKLKVSEPEVNFSPQTMEAFLTRLGMDKDEASQQVESQKLVLTNLNQMLKANFIEMRLEVSWPDGGRRASLPVVTHIIPDKPKIQITTTVEN